MTTETVERDVRAMLARRAGDVTPDIAAGEAAIAERLAGGDIAVVEALAGPSRAPRRRAPLLAAAAAVAIAGVVATLLVSGDDDDPVRTGPATGVVLDVEQLSAAEVAALPALHQESGPVRDVAVAYLADRLGVDRVTTADDPDAVLTVELDPAERSDGLVLVRWARTVVDEDGGRTVPHSGSVYFRPLAGASDVWDDTHVWDVVATTTDGVQVDVRRGPDGGVTGTVGSLGAGEPGTDEQVLAAVVSGLDLERGRPVEPPVLGTTAPLPDGWVTGGSPLPVDVDLPELAAEPVVLRVQHVIGERWLSLTEIGLGPAVEPGHEDTATTPAPSPVKEGSSATGRWLGMGRPGATEVDVALEHLTLRYGEGHTVVRTEETEQTEDGRSVVLTSVSGATITVDLRRVPSADTWGVVRIGSPGLGALEADGAVFLVSPTPWTSVTVTGYQDSGGPVEAQEATSFAPGPTDIIEVAIDLGDSRWVEVELLAQDGSVLRLVQPRADAQQGDWQGSSTSSPG